MQEEEEEEVQEEKRIKRRCELSVSPESSCLVPLPFEITRSAGEAVGQQ